MIARNFEAARRSKRSIRFRLILIIYPPLAILVAAFLICDYSREVDRRVADKRIALEEEAKTILPAVLQFRNYGKGSVQQYIDTVCGRMRDADSPGHHIAVELDGESFQAAAHHRASPEFLFAMRKAVREPNGRAAFGRSELIVGLSQTDAATVYVSESLDSLREAVIDDIALRLIGFVILAIVAALVLNVVLLRVISVPLDRLVATVQRIGAGELGTVADSFATAELDYLAQEINDMSASLAATDDNRRMQFKKARDIQQNLLPQEFDLPGINVARIFEPADEIGGDFYDILPYHDGTWLFCVADVTGHGVPAAMTAAMLKTLLLEAIAQCRSPASIMRFINLRLAAVTLAGDFVTLALVRADPRTGNVTYASAGHEPVWLLPHNGKVRELSSTGMILGIDQMAIWDEIHVDLAVGDRLLIVTDGVTETFNQAGLLFGRQRLASLATQCEALSLEQTAERINNSLKDYRGVTAQTDDVTMLLVELTGETAQWGDPNGLR